MSQGVGEWRWVGEDGAQSAGTEAQLRSELSSERIPSFIFVWRSGWLEWLPAMQVAELASALPPGRADNPVKPREREGTAKPPPPPLYRYSVIKRRAESLTTAAPTKTRSTPPPAPAAPVEHDSVEDVDLEALEKSSPVNQFSVDDIELDKNEFGPPPFEPPSIELTKEEFGPPPGPPPADALPNAAAVYVPPHKPRTSDRPPPDLADDIPRFPASPNPPSDLHAYANLAEQTKSARRSSRRRFPLVAGGAVAVVAVVVIGFTLRGGSRRSEASPSASASAGAAPRVTCKVSAPAAKVADSAEPSVQPLLTSVAGTTRIAVGYAESDTTAIGVTLDPSSLDRDQVFQEKKKGKLLSVVPTTENAKLRFDVSREGGANSIGRTVDAAPPFSIASGPSGILRVASDGRAEVVFSVNNPELTIPRVASTASGHAVTARSGGKAGKILAGFLEVSGQKKGDLFPVPGTSDFVGVPAIAANEGIALLTFAARGSSDPGWGLAASRVKWGLPPSAATRLVVPSGGPGGDAISPSVAALPEGRWLLTWTEGQSGSRVVRSVVLGPELDVVSAPQTLSPDGKDAGQAVMAATGSGALVLFYVLAGGSQQLWATAVECSGSPKP